MTDTKVGQEAPSKPTTATIHTSQSPQKSGKTKKTKESEEKVPITISVSTDFARKLKIVVSAMDGSSGEYVESHMSSVLKRDLKKILEEIA